MLEHIKNSLVEAANALDNLLNSPELLSKISAASTQLITTFANQGKVISCGNGGSMCDASHFAEELTGRYRLDRPALPAIAINDSGHLSCVANDYGYEQVFARYISAHGRAGDSLLAISTSGSSQNVLLASQMAKQCGMKVIALTGRSESPLAAIADVYIATPAGRYADRVQELHIKIIHILIEMVERHFYPELY